MSISLMVSFGLPRHFHLLLCNCLVFSLFVFCGKSNKVTKLQSLVYKEDHLKSYRIIKCPRESYTMVQDPMGWVSNLRET